MCFMFVFFIVKMCNDGKVNECIYWGVLVIELIYIVILVYDDVVDDSNWRCGFFLINVFWKNKIVVLVGDYFFLKGLLFLIDNDDFDLLKIILVVVWEMSEGELF